MNVKTMIHRDLLSSLFGRLFEEDLYSNSPKKESYMDIITSKNWAFKQVNLDAISALHQILEKQQIKCSIPLICETVFVMTQIRSFLMNSDKPESIAISYEMPPKEWSLNVFKRQNKDYIKKDLAFLNSIFSLLSKIKTTNKFQNEVSLIKYETAKFKNPILIITKDTFFGFCNELHISKSSHLIRLSNEGVKVLNQLRTRGRAYAYFINLIYLKTKIKLNECCKNKFNVDSLELSSQKRIESLFKSSLRKTKSSKEKNENCLKTDISSSNKTLKKREHPISYAEIKRDALLAFKDLKISDSIIEKCVAYILNSYTVSGKSCIQTYDEKSVQVKAIYKKDSAPVSPKAEVPNTEPPKIYIQLNGSSQSYQ